MLAEYVLAEKSIMDKKPKGFFVGIKDGETGKTPEKKVPTPDRAKRPEGSKKSEPAGVKPVTERARKPELKKASDLFKVANNRSKPMADSPSNRTRGAKRWLQDPYQAGMLQKWRRAKKAIEWDNSMGKIPEYLTLHQTILQNPRSTCGDLPGKTVAEKGPTMDSWVKEARWSKRPAGGEVRATGKPRQRRNRNRIASGDETAATPHQGLPKTARPHKENLEKHLVNSYTTNGVN
ncbi:hypothetical protein R1sor_001588 [Riccia sorocarpa]|uniref:Uncharacterized protein n=1 Tax=Riccia sorocarpa TaxID=122646 RepID=A0ABD3GYB6_9MARC